MHAVQECMHAHQLQDVTRRLVSEYNSRHILLCGVSLTSFLMANLAFFILSKLKSSAPSGAGAGRLEPIRFALALLLVIITQLLN